MTIQELKDWVLLTSFDNQADVELIKHAIENDKQLSKYDPAIITCESEFSDEDYLADEFMAYFDERTGSEIKKHTDIGVEYTENEESFLILFKNVTMNS